MPNFILSPEHAIDELHNLRCGLEFLSTALPEEEPIGSLGYILSLFSDRMGECNEVLDAAECHEVEEELRSGVYPTGPVSFEHPCSDFFNSGFAEPDDGAVNG